MTIDYVDERLVYWRRWVRWERRVARAHIPVVVAFALFGRWLTAAAFSLAAVGWELLARSNEKHVRWLLEQAARLEMEEL